MVYTDGIHLITDGELQELHDFAKSITLGRHWFDSNPKHPHYDLFKSPIPRKLAFNLAIKKGAIQKTSKELIDIINKKQENGK